MRGATPGRINLHLPSELHITPLPPHISNLPQPITCDDAFLSFIDVNYSQLKQQPRTQVKLVHTNVELSSKIFANPKDILRLVPKEVKIVQPVLKLPRFRLLHLVARPGWLRDPEVMAMGMPTLRSIDTILVNASKHCSIRGGGRKQSFSFPLKLHPRMEFVWSSRLEVVVTARTLTHNKFCDFVFVTHTIR